MIKITTKAAALLREKLAQRYMEAEGLHTLADSPEVMTSLKQKVADGLFKAGIGFRLLLAASGETENSFMMKIDQKRDEDEVIDQEGLKLFIDPTSTPGLGGLQLDYIEGPEASFVLADVERHRREEACEGHGEG